MYVSVEYEYYSGLLGFWNQNERFQLITNLLLIFETLHGDRTSSEGDTKRPCEMELE